MERKIHMANIEKVCRKKEYGGLGIVDIERWNTEAYCGFIYKVLTLSESILARWIREYKMKHKHFCRMEVSNDCSWTLRGLFKHRRTAKHLIKLLLQRGRTHTCGMTYGVTVHP